jgi:PKD domain
MTVPTRIVDFFHRRSSLSRSGRAAADRRHGSRRRSLPILEHLEDRQLLASFVVTNLADSGAGSLRDAINQANVSADGSSTISFQPGLTGAIELSTTTNDAASLGPSFFVISKDITIQGPTGGTDNILLQNLNGSSGGRFFTVTPNVELILDNLALAGGYAVGGNGGEATTAGAGNGTGGGAAGLGGAIFNDGGAIILSKDTFEGNQAVGGNGGEPYTGTADEGGAGGGGGGMGGNASYSQAGGPNAGLSGIGPPVTATNDGNPATGPGGGGGAGTYNQQMDTTAGSGSAGGFGGGGGGGAGADGSVEAGGGGLGGFGGGGGGGGTNTTLGGAGGPPGYGGGPGTGGTPLDGQAGGYGGGGAGMGGAIFSEGGFVTVYNSTFYVNNAIGGHGNNNNNGQGLGGAIFMFDGSLMMINATIVDNGAQQGAGVDYLGIGGASGDVVGITNTLFDDAPFSDLTIGSPDGTSAIISGANDLFTTVPSFYGSFPDSIVTSTPGLGDFGYHGGPTPTVPLLQGSPAIGQANPNALPSPTDQRGYPRNLAAPDIGADEFQPPSIQLVAGSGQTIFVGTAAAAPLQVQVLDDDAPVPGVIVSFAAPFSVNLFTDSPVAAASFAGSMFVEATTNAQGIATAPTLTADAVAGSYTIEASTAIGGTSLAPAIFTETNAVPLPPTVVTGGPYTIAQGQSLALNASGSTDPYGLPLTDSWTINGHANAATGVNPTLTWAQLQALGLDVGAGTFPAAISVRVAASVGPPSTVSTSLTITDTPPVATIQGLPPGNLDEGTTLTLTPAVSDVSTAETAAGFDELWEFSAATGQTVVAGQQLHLDGNNPVPLPSDLIAGATSLTVTVTFQTTSDGVILGYQNQPTSTTPTQYMPALYVGTDGHLYAEIFDGSFREMVSGNQVNNGQQHTAELIETGSAQSLYLDGTLVDTLSGTPNPLNMTVDQLGTGYTLGHPNAPGGYFPFIGTIDSVQITTGSAPVGAVAFPAGAGGAIAFTPAMPGADTVTLVTEDEDGGNATETASLHVVELAVSAGPALVVTQGVAFTGSGSFSDVGGAGPWTATINYGDGTGTQPLTLNSTHGFNYSHSYSNAGIFTITVTVTDDGASAEATRSVSVTGFTVNGDGTRPSPVTSLTYTFNNPTAIEPGAFVLRRDGHHTSIKMAIAPEADGMTYLISFSGPEVVDGSLPEGKYTLITLHKKVTVLSGPKMTRNDINTFVSRPDDGHGDKKDGGSSRKPSEGRLDPPSRAPAKFPGRTVHHDGAIRPASSRQDPAGTIPLTALDQPKATSIGLLAPRKEHYG